MATGVIEPERVHVLADREPNGAGSYVLYWMQSAVRTSHNQALEYAVQTANRHQVPLLVAFGIDVDYPESSPRHHRFMLQGLSAIESTLRQRQIGLRVEIGSPPDVAGDLAGDAVEMITERSYLRHLRRWRADLAETIEVPVTEIETNLVVPVETVSDKREYAARTIRPKIHAHLERFLVDLRTTAVERDGTTLSGGVDVSDPDTLLSELGISGDVQPTARFDGGQHQAAAALERFLEERSERYQELRGEPSAESVSHLSPYLHFGHISPITAVLAAADVMRADDYDTFVEELVVRRELSHNYTWFEPDYDSYSALPDWARKTLAEHRDDARPHRYTRPELEAAETHDRYWNASMIEMRETGYLHNYMRMYWGKRILQWTNTPEYGYGTALELNNKYLLDGRDPNSYVGVAWCFGLHDRAWNERDVFGKVRTMTADGLKRKKDVDGYVRLVESLTGSTIGPPGHPDA